MKNIWKWIKCPWRSSGRSGSICCARRNTKRMKKKEIGLSQNIREHTYTYKHTITLHFFYDVWTPASPRGVSATAQSGPFQASNIYFQRGMIFPEALYPIKAIFFFFLPRPSFPVLMEVWESVISQLQRNLPGEAAAFNQAKLRRPGEMVDTSLGLGTERKGGRCRPGGGKRPPRRPVLDQVTFIWWWELEK